MSSALLRRAALGPWWRTCALLGSGCEIGCRRKLGVAYLFPFLASAVWREVSSAGLRSFRAHQLAECSEKNQFGKTGTGQRKRKAKRGEYSEGNSCEGKKREREDRKKSRRKNHHSFEKKQPKKSRKKTNTVSRKNSQQRVMKLWAAHDKKCKLSWNNPKHG